MEKDFSTVYLGVDVGSASVRAALFSENGEYLISKSKPITINNPLPDIYQQSSNEIWSAVCECVAESVQTIRDQYDKTLEIGGIGFAATCSLVVIGPNEEGLSIDPSSDDSRWDIVMWMDHRAKSEALEINQMGHPVLQSVGGSISLEMQTPKLMWIKRNKPEIWNKAVDFYDLSDFLSWKSTGSKIRSLCSAVCKWTYNGDGGKDGWSPSYFRDIGLEDLVEEKFARIGQEIVPPGSFIGYLLPEVMKQMKLDKSCRIPVAASLIDAHSGALGMLATQPAAEIRGSVTNQLGIIAGTSTCHMILHNKPLKIFGIWGPYDSAILSDMWLHEGGQSSVGSLLDHVIENHPAYDEAMKNSKLNNIPIQEYLVVVLKELQKNAGQSNVAFLTQQYHMWPDFHGNRSPISNPTLKGMICGLTLECSIDNLAVTLLATIQALAYGTRHIVQELLRNGYNIRVGTICGGLARSELFIQTHSDILQIEIVKPHQIESVLLGAAMLGAAAAHSDSAKVSSESKLLDVISKMKKGGDIFHPDKSVADYHEKKFQVFLEMLKDQEKYKKMME